MTTVTAGSRLSVRALSSRASGHPRILAVATLVGASVLGIGGTPVPEAEAAVQTVSNCADSGTGSLRQAILSAHAGDTISFALSPACSFIPLASPLALTTNVTIKGPGAASLTVDETKHTPIFSVGTGVTATISGLTIENGSTGINNAGKVGLTDSIVVDNGSTTGGGIVNTGTLSVTDTTFSKNGVDAPDEGGGAIDNDGGSVTVTGSTLSDNTASSGADGGAIYTRGGTVTIADSTLTGNTTGDGSGGGIYNEGGVVTVTTSTVSDDSAVNGTGGGIDNDSGTVGVTDSTVAHDSADYDQGGGGIYNGATVTVANSTFFGNNATFGGEGGAILNAGTAAIVASTFAHNSADHIGGALYGPATVTTSLWAENSEGGNCSQTVTDGGFNLDDDGSCGFSAATDHSDTPAVLAPGGLAENGGPTKTIALEADSPAGNTVASASLCATPDQRGVTRTTPCDIGAVELVLPPQAITSANSATAVVGKAFSFAVTTTGVPVPSIAKKGKLPKHLTLVRNSNGTATISGTPLKAGVYPFVLTSTYGKGGTKTVVTQPFTLTVRT